MECFFTLSREGRREREPNFPGWFHQTHPSQNKVRKHEEPRVNHSPSPSAGVPSGQGGAVPGVTVLPVPVQELASQSHPQQQFLSGVKSKAWECWVQEKAAPSSAPSQSCSGVEPSFAFKINKGQKFCLESSEGERLHKVVLRCFCVLSAILGAL